MRRDRGIPHRAIKWPMAERACFVTKPTNLNVFRADSDVSKF